MLRGRLSMSRIPSLIDVRIWNSHSVSHFRSKYIYKIIWIAISTVKYSCNNIVSCTIDTVWGLTLLKACCYSRQFFCSTKLYNNFLNKKQLMPITKPTELCSKQRPKGVAMNNFHRVNKIKGLSHWKNTMGFFHSLNPKYSKRWWYIKEAGY